MFGLLLLLFQIYIFPFCDTKVAVVGFPASGVVTSENEFLLAFFASTWKSLAENLKKQQTPTRSSFRSLHWLHLFFYYGTNTRRGATGPSPLERPPHPHPPTQASFHTSLQVLTATPSSTRLHPPSFSSSFFFFFIKCSVCFFLFARFSFFCFVRFVFALCKAS